MMRFRKKLSLLLAVIMTMSFMPTAVMAAGADDYHADFELVKTSDKAYNGEDVMRLDFYINASGSNISSVQSALFMYDTSKLALLNKNAVSVTQDSLANNIGNAVAAYLYENPNTLDSFSAGVYALTSSGVLSLQPDWTAGQTTEFTSKTKIMSVYLGLADPSQYGWDNLSSDCFRLATAAEASANSQTAVVSLNDGVNPEYCYLYNDGTPDTLTNAPTLTTSGFSFSKGSYTGTEASTPQADNYSIIGTPATVTLTAQSISGEVVEYAKSATSAAPASGWQDSNVFSGLAAGSYYFFARVKENANHAAGAISSPSTVVSIADLTQDLTVSPVDFGTIIIGETQPGEQSITITNNGNTVATVTDILVGNPSAYNISGSECAIAVGQTINSWKIEPAANLPVGNYDDVITVISDTGATSTAQVTFSIEPVTCTLVVTPIDFGSVEVGYSRPAKKSIVVKNNGNSPATLTDLSISGKDFEISGFDEVILRPGSDATIASIQPNDKLAAGTYSTVMTVTYDDGSSDSTVTASARFVVKNKQNSGGGGGGGGGSLSNVKVDTKAPDDVDLTLTSEKDGEKIIAVIDSKEAAELIKDAKEHGEVVLNPQGANGAKEVEVVIPKDIVAELSKDTKADIQLNAGDGVRVTIPHGELSKINGDMHIIATKDGNNQYSVSVNSGDAGRAVTAKVSFQNTNGNVAYIVDANGNKTPIKFSSVDGNRVYAMVTTPATIVIENHANLFTDMAGHSMSTDADFVANRELFVGVGDEIFDPNGSMTMGMMATVLHRLAGAPAVNAAGEEWYAAGSTWASSNGYISSSNPSQVITRLDLATTLYRYAKTMGLDRTAKADSAIPFSDTSHLTGESLDAMQWAVDTGILQGYGNGTVGADNQCTRIQVAAMFERFIQNAVKQD